MNEGPPKNFVVRCPNCRWRRLTAGIKSELEDLVEINPNCPNCGKARRFRCPVCKAQAQMIRIQGNT